MIHEPRQQGPGLRFARIQQLIVSIPCPPAKLSSFNRDAIAVHVRCRLAAPGPNLSPKTRVD